MASDDFHAFQHRTKRPHYCNDEKTKFYCAKRTYDIRTFSKRKEYYFNPLEFATFKNVIIKTRSSGLSYHKIAKAFGISSRTVFNWVGKIWAIPKTLIHVNIKAIANAFYSQLHAYRMGWIATFNTENILNGVGIH